MATLARALQLLFENHTKGLPNYYVTRGSGKDFSENNFWCANIFLNNKLLGQ